MFHALLFINPDEINIFLKRSYNFIHGFSFKWQKNSPGSDSAKAKSNSYFVKDFFSLRSMIKTHFLKMCAVVKRLAKEMEKLQEKKEKFFFSVFDFRMEQKDAYRNAHR